MEIEVRIDNEVVFSGLAEDFLYAHDDIELEYTLDALETKPIGAIIEYDGMEIEKLESLIWDQSFFEKFMLGKIKEKYIK